MLFLFYRMSKRYVCIAIIVLLNSFLFSQNKPINVYLSKEDSTKIVQLKNELKSATDTQRLNMYYQLGVYLIGHDNSQVTSYADKLIEKPNEY
jgi:hypothetical protein